jgi:hypothetical protein
MELIIESDNTKDKVSGISDSVTILVDDLLFEDAHLISVVIHNLMLFPSISLNILGI